MNETANAMLHRTILTIAGSDPSGGAGIQADIKAIEANGGYAAAAVAAITVQNTCGVQQTEVVSAPLLSAQISAIFADLQVAAVKTGMLGSEQNICAVAQVLADAAPPHLVCDPVLAATTGQPLLEPRALDALKTELLPLASLITPNAVETEVLTGISVSTLTDAQRAGEVLLEGGAKAVLVKGGHLAEGAGSDVLITGERVQFFPGEWLLAEHTHGTGCIYAAAIATQLAHGQPLVEAIAIAKAFITEAIRGGLAVGHGAGPADPFFFLKQTRGAGPIWLGRLRQVAEGSA